MQARAAGRQEVYYKDDTINKAGLWGLYSYVALKCSRTVTLNNL